MGGISGTVAVVGVMVSSHSSVQRVKALVNRAILPVVCEQLSVATGREVNVEDKVAPAGPLGLTSLVTAGPIGWPAEQPGDHQERGRDRGAGRAAELAVLRR